MLSRCRASCCEKVSPRFKHRGSEGEELPTQKRRKEQKGQDRTLCWFYWRDTLRAETYQPKILFSPDFSDLSVVSVSEGLPVSRSLSLLSVGDPNVLDLSGLPQKLA